MKKLMTICTHYMVNLPVQRPLVFIGETLCSKKIYPHRVTTQHVKRKTNRIVSVRGPFTEKPKSYGYKETLQSKSSKNTHLVGNRNTNDGFTSPSMSPCIV